LADAERRVGICWVVMVVVVVVVVEVVVVVVMEEVWAGGCLGGGMEDGGNDSVSDGSLGLLDEGTAASSLLISTDGGVVRP